MYAWYVHGINCSFSRAMSKDIDERHKRMKHQRQLTERYRSSGNEQYKKRQYAEAMKTYLTGIELGERYALSQTSLPYIHACCVPSSRKTTELVCALFSSSLGNQEINVVLIATIDICATAYVHACIFDPSLFPFIACRTNAAIHSNCAMAALKCNCFASAIEHCDKALHIIEFFHNNNYEDVDGDESRDKHITLRIKTYQRRATARMKLAHLVDAVRDFTKAVEISRLADGDSKHKETALLEKELADAQLALEEERREKKMPGTDADGNTSAARDESGSGRGGKGARLMELKRIEALVSRLRETSKDDMESTYADACVELCTAMSEERESAPDVRTCVRVCGGLETLGKLIIELGRGNDQHVGQRHDNNGESGNGSATDGLLPLPEQRRKSGNDACTHTSSRLFHALTTLRASCATKKNVDFIMAQPHLLGAVISIVARPGDDDVTSSTMHDSAVAASDLLFEISRSCANAVGDDGFRTRLVSALTSAKGAPLTSLISVLSRGGSDEVKKACLSTTLASNRLLSNILGALSILLENAGARNILHADREDTTRDDKRELIAELSTFFMVCTTLFFGSSANTATMCLLQMTLNCIGNSVLEPRPLKSVATNRPLMAAVSAMTSSLVRSARQERTWGFGGPVVVEALSFFVNVLNDETARDFVCGTSLSSSVGGTDSNGGGGLVQDFIDLSTGVVVTNHADHAGSSAASRASIIISKLARFKDSVKARLVDAQNGAGVNNLQGLIERGMKATAMKASTTMSLEKDDSVDEKSRAAAVEATALIDTIMRTLAVCTATNDHAEKAIALVSRGAGFEFIVKGLEYVRAHSKLSFTCDAYIFRYARSRHMCMNRANEVLTTTVPVVCKPIPCTRIDYWNTRLHARAFVTRSLSISARCLRTASSATAACA